MHRKKLPQASQTPEHKADAGRSVPTCRGAPESADVRERWSVTDEAGLAGQRPHLGPGVEAHPAALWEGDDDDAYVDGVRECVRAPPESKPCRESRRIQPRRGEGPETRTSGRSNIQTQSFDIVLFNEVLLSLFLQRATPSSSSSPSSSSPPHSLAFVVPMGCR